MVSSVVSCAVPCVDILTFVSRYFISTIIAGVADFSNTSISGTFDTALCNRTDGTGISFLGADCGRTTPEVDCSCCTYCCDGSTGDCEGRLLQICEVSASRMALGEVFEKGSTQHESDCTCTEDGSSFSCVGSQCQSCSLNGTICGDNMDYGYSFGEDGEIVSFTTSFQYVKGRTEKIRLESSKNTTSAECRVYVDDEECSVCQVFRCADEAEGLYVDCTNIVGGDGGFYATCTGAHEEGGVFEVFDMFYRDVFTGCRPTLEPFLE